MEKAYIRNGKKLIDKKPYPAKVNILDLSKEDFFTTPTIEQILPQYQ